MHPIAEVIDDFVEKYVGMGVALHFYTDLLVEPDVVVAGLRSIPRPIYKKPTFFVLGNDIELKKRPALPIKTRIAANSELSIAYNVILHDFSAAIFNLYTNPACFHLIVYHITIVS